MSTPSSVGDAVPVPVRRVEEEVGESDMVVVLLCRDGIWASGAEGSRWIEDPDGDIRDRISTALGQPSADPKVSSAEPEVSFVEREVHSPAFEPGPPELSVGSELAGHRIEGIVGRGGMGVVYRARDLMLERVVALKVVAPELAREDPGFRERFLRESRLAASIRHPNVVCTHRAGEELGLLFITMDLIPGTDLRALLLDRGRLAPGVAAAVVSQIAAGLDAAHGVGLVHRDVKPANVLVEGETELRSAYLSDFGLSKRIVSQSGLTRTRTFVGTVDYVAPEQLADGVMDARADVYALGCVLFQALTGAVPYPRENEPAKLWAHIADPPPSVRERAPELPRAFDEVVRRAMAKDPEDRYLSAGDLGRAALAAARGQRASRAER